ncbi:MAG: glycosyltransferase [Candidatus Diapherotrites archaeon]
MNKIDFKPKISVVIPAYNRNELLKRTLKALLNQSIKIKDYEIIVVGCKKNKTKKVFDEIKTKNIFFYEIDSDFPDRKRNFGILKAKADLIAFTDDDVTPKNNWLEELIVLFKNPEIAGIEGKTVGHSKGVFYHSPQNISGNYFPACNIAFRKNILRKVKGFDENYNFFREDTDLAFRVLSNNKKIAFAPNAIVYHPPRKISRLSILKELFLIKGDVRLYKKFPQLYKKTFGFICRGGLKQALFAWPSFLLLIFFSLNNHWIFFFGLLLIIIFVKYLIGLKGKKYSFFDAFSYILISYLRDLLFPFFFLFYYFSVSLK